MALLNNPDMFTAAEMTDTVNKLPGTVYRFGSMFEQVGSRTTKIDIEIMQGRLTLVSDSPRGSVPEPLGRRQPERRITTIPATHLAQADVLSPEDIQDLRAFGTTELATQESIVNDKLTIMKRNLDMTLEYHRVGAVKGVVMAPAGRELVNIYDVFGVTKKTQAFIFPATTQKSSNPVLDAILAAKRAAEEAMGGNPYSRFEAIVGSNFYDNLTGCALVREAYSLWAANLSSFGDNDFRKRGFTYGGVTFYEASETVGGKSLVDDDKGHLYPVGPGIWRVYNAPADWMEAVNTMGRQYYARMDERPKSRGFDIEVQANPLTLCLYPEALVELTITA